MPGRRLLRWGVVCAGCMAEATAQVAPLVRTGDAWSLHPAPLPSYRILDVLATQDHRMLAGAEGLGALVDVLTGTQLARDDRPGTWHGHYVADLRLGARPVEALEIDLNLMAYHVTASAGYRRTAGVLPGLSLHFGHEVAELDGEPVGLELLIHDLGLVTLGSGLLFERVPMEGTATRLVWNEAFLRLLTAGQVHGTSDDLFVLSSGYGPVELSWHHWKQWVRDASNHVSLAVDLRGEELGLAAEGAVRLPDDFGGWASAALLRGDWRPPPWEGLQLHLGSQVRWYGQGIAPTGDQLYPATLALPTPQRDRAYITQSFEAWWPSAYYHQLWSVGMGEVRWTLGDWVLVGDVEGRVLAYDDPTSPTRRLPTASAASDGELLPQTRYQRFYRVGVDWRPLPDQAFRLGAAISNRVPEVEGGVTWPTVISNIEKSPLLVLEIEVEL